MKARRVKGLEPAGPLDANLRRIVAVRTAELCSFAEAVRDPRAVRELHAMRIAAKRLRYVLEMSEPVLGDPARQGARDARKLQDLLGEIHDCDELIPRVKAHLKRMRSEDATAVRGAAGPRARDLDPAAARSAPHRRRYAGLEALTAYTRARREVLYAAFLRQWSRIEQSDFAQDLGEDVP
jgi:CHAD domain-containing protein